MQPFLPASISSPSLIHGHSSYFSSTNPPFPSPLFLFLPHHAFPPLFAHRILAKMTDDAMHVVDDDATRNTPPSDMEIMREKFSKLLLGEDMSGGGKGVSSALALSNAITNLAASVFGEQSKLEPMSPERKTRWMKEMGWLLSVTDYIVEFVAVRQKNKDGSNMEVMRTQMRGDLLSNIPALRELDGMLLETLDNFASPQEFWYASKNADDSQKGVQRNDKWWLPTVKVPTNGLSDESREFLQLQKETVIQVLKSAMAINAEILSDMEIPENYIESLPKHGKSSLGDAIYRNITDDYFDPQQFLSTLDLSSEHKVLDLKNRIEASIVIWKRKLHNYSKDMKSSWGLALGSEKRGLFEERAETILLLLKHEFPGLPQSSLEISKIQYNKDVGLAVLESYSRVLETLANTVMSRIDGVLFADSVARDPSVAVCKREASADENAPSPTVSPSGSPSMTLSDFMGWEYEPPSESETEKTPSAAAGDAEPPTVNNESAAASTIRKYLYMNKLDIGGLRSPIVRH